MFQLYDDTNNDYDLVGWSTSMNKLVVEKMSSVNFEGKLKLNNSEFIHY